VSAQVDGRTDLTAAVVNNGTAVVVTKPDASLLDGFIRSGSGTSTTLRLDLDSGVALLPLGPARIQPCHFSLIAADQGRRMI